MRARLSRLLAANLASRQRLGFSAVAASDQEHLAELLKGGCALGLNLAAPLSSQGEKLLEAMLKVLPLPREQIGGKGRQTLLLGFTKPADDNLFCWHPDLLLQKPALKREAYLQLKKAAALLAAP